VQEGLARGYKLGIMASSDAHGEHPGAYDLGLMAAYAEDLSRRSLWEAFRAKRVYGVTGDRITLDLRVNGQGMGSTLRDAGQGTGRRTIEVDVVAWDKVERLDVIKNNTRLHTVVEPEGRQLDERRRLRFMVEWGWDRKTANDWENGVEMSDGRILQAIPCYRSRVASRVGRGITRHSDTACTWTSHTEQIQGGAPARTFADALWLEVECGHNAPITLSFACGGRHQELTLTPEEIMAGSSLIHMQPAAATNNGNHWATMETLAKVKVHQGWPTEQLTLHVSYEDEAQERVPGRTDFYYVRVIQRNGQRAWSSPIWVEA